MRDAPCESGNNRQTFPNKLVRIKLFIISKRTVPSTPPLCRRGGWGVRLFFFIRIKNLDILINKISETRVKNTCCEPVCN